MSGDSLRVMMALGFSNVTSVANGSASSPRAPPSSTSSRFWSSKRPVALVAAPRPRLRSAGTMRSAIASGRWRGAGGAGRIRVRFMGMFRNGRAGTNHEQAHRPTPTLRQGLTSRGTSAINAINLARSLFPARRSVRERVAGIDVAAFQAGGQPFLALLRGAMGEAVGHGVAAGCRLQPVVADRLGGRQRPFDIARLEDLPFVVRVVGPHA